MPIFKAHKELSRHSVVGFIDHFCTSLRMMPLKAVDLGATLTKSLEA